MSTAAVRLVLVGASGRMGRELLRLLPTMPALRLSGAVASEHSAALGSPALAADAPGSDAAGRGGAAVSRVMISAALPPLLPGADVVIDFSTGRAVAATLAACVAARVPLLIGTTGLPRELDAPLAAAAEAIALLVAPNTSVGVNLLLELVRRAAQALPALYDIEILELHHRHKLDAPSGTALALGAAAAQGRGQTPDTQAGAPRQGGSGPRPAGQIGFAVLRGGDAVGEHEVLFLGPGERLSLAHCATDRVVFARGALLAAQWLVRQAPGRYAMSDFLANKLNS